MSRVLLDTHAFIWFVSNATNLPDSIKDQIESAEAVFLSIASLWEMAIKLNIGKLPLQGAFEDIEPQLMALGIAILPITFTDTIQIRYLPFDRILVAQATNNSLILISRDLAFDSYSIQRMW